MEDILNQVVELSIRECSKKKNQKKIKEYLVGPVLEYILCQLRPYFIGFGIFLTLVVVLMLSVFFLLIFK